MIPIFIYGQTVSLAPIEERHLSTIMTWRMSPDVDRWQATHPILTPDGQKKWFDKISKEDDSLYFVIGDRKSNNPVGLISLTDIDTLGGAQPNIYLGSPEFYGGGYSHEAYILLLDLAFNQLGRRHLYARVKKENLRARAFHKMFGFLETERGERDMIWIELCKEDYMRNRQRMVSLVSIKASKD